MTSAPRERSADVQDLGMWQVRQEQPAPPAPPTKTSRSRTTGTGCCGCESHCASRPKCRSCGEARGRQRQQQQGQSSRRPPSMQSPFAAVVAEEAAKLHAQLGQPAAINVPMIEDGPDEAPSEEAEREKLRTLLANLNASVAALTPVAAGDEDVYQILQAKQERRKQVQKYKALVEEEESVKALVQGREGKGAGSCGDRGGDRKGRQRAEVPDQVTITDESSAVGSRTAERSGRRRKGELQSVARAVHTPLRRNSSWPKCRQRCRCSPRLFARRREQPRPPGRQRSVWRRYRPQVGRATTAGAVFGLGQRRGFNPTGARSKPGNADGRPTASEAGPRGFSRWPRFLGRGCHQTNRAKGCARMEFMGVGFRSREHRRAHLLHRWCRASLRRGHVESPVPASRPLPWWSPPLVRSGGRS